MTPTQNLKIAILKTDTMRPELKNRFGDHDQLFIKLFNQIEHSLTFETFPIIDNNFHLPSFDYDGYLITGSSHSAYEDLPWIKQLRAFIKELDEKKLKTLGICFGHQILWDTLGGKVIRSPKGYGLGVYETFSQNTANLDPGLSSYKLLYSHQDQVVAIPEDAKVIAGHDFCPFSSVKKGQHIITWQGHPEFNPEIVLDIANYKKDTIPTDTYQKTLSSLEEATDHLTVATWMRDFFL